MKNLLSFLLLLSITAFMSCKGDIGDMGPAGQDGIDGTDGQDGQDGNANVRSYKTTISASDWVAHSFYVSFVDLQVPLVTEEVATNGIVMVYWLYEPANVWFTLPFSETITQSYYYWSKAGLVRIHSLSDSGTPNPLTGEIRVVAITPQGRVRYPDLDWTNYEEVKNRLQLPE